MVSIIALQYPKGKKIDHVEGSEIAEWMGDNASNSTNNHVFPLKIQLKNKTIVTI